MTPSARLKSCADRMLIPWAVSVPTTLVKRPGAPGAQTSTSEYPASGKADQWTATGSPRPNPLDELEMLGDLDAGGAQDVAVWA